MKLSPKERFELAVSHRDADRPVVDYMADPEITESLKTFFQVDDEGLLEVLQVDVRGCGCDYVGPPLREFSDGSQEDMFGVRKKRIKTDVGWTSVKTHHPLAGMETIDEFRKQYSLPPYEYLDFGVIKENAAKQNRYALTLGFTLWYQYFHLRGMEQALMDMALNEEFYHYVMQTLADWWKGYLERSLQQADGAIDYVITYEDFGSTRGLLISLADVREKVLAYYRDLSRLFSNYGTRFAFHSCGAVSEVIPDLVKLGVTILDPIQVSAKGMDISALKETYGDKLTFRGGIDTTALLPRGTPEEVRNEVRRTVGILGRHGGYIFCTSNQINADAPLENVLAMYEAVLGERFWEAQRVA